MPDKKPNGDFYKRIRQFGMITTIPIMLAAGPLVGFFTGDFLDKKFKTAPIFLAAFSVLGFIAGAREAFRVIKMAAKEEDDKKT